MLDTPNITVTGFASGFLVKTAKLNNVPVQISNDESFQSSLTLTEGENKITLTALDDNGIIVGDNTIFVTLDSKSPVVVITEPDNNKVVNQQPIVIKGTIDDPTILSLNINDSPVNIINGNFETNVYLKSGLNKIIAMVYDKAGNLGLDSVIVDYQPLVDVDEDFRAVDTEFKSLQIYPNPISNKTEIQYKIVTSSIISLSISYNLGIEVKRLVDNQFIEPGQHSIEFDASSLSSGVYFCTLRAGGKIETIKFVVLK
ncbi:MAG: T9SS type A sorting domain-containing protein [Bacteroidetes bacterium]|nr:T9SS type A sorting domain-containing protein [Bacteroidota bacterium]